MKKSLMTLFKAKKTTPDRDENSASGNHVCPGFASPAEGSFHCRNSHTHDRGPSSRGESRFCPAAGGLLNLLGNGGRCSENEEHYCLLLEASPEAICIQQGGLVVYMNPAGLELFGAASAREVVGKKLLEYVHPDFRAIAEGRMLGVERDGPRMLSGELKILRVNGEALDVEAVAAPLLLRGAPALQLLIRDITARIRAEKAIRFQANVLAQVSDAVIVADQDDRIIYWNQGAERLFERSAAEALGFPFTEVTGDCRVFPGKEAAGRPTLSSTGSWRGEAVHQTRAGRQVYVESSVSEFTDEGGRSLGLLAVVHDITGRKLLERELRDSEERCRALVESSPEAIWVEQDGVCVYLNKAGHELLGARDFEAVKGKHLLECIHPDFRDIAAAMLQDETEQGRRSNSWALKMVRLSGHELDAEAVATDITFGGRPATQVIIKDVRERRNTELRLRLQATVLSQVHDAVVAVGRDGRIIFWNKGAEHLYKVAAEDAIGKQREDIYRYRWINQDQERQARERLASSSFLSGENIHILSSGEEIYVESSVSVLTDWSYAPTGWLAVMRDVTERNMYDRKLRESEERYRSLVETSPDAILVHQAGKIVYANSATLKLLGAPDPGRVLGKDLLEFVHPDFRAGAQASLLDAEGQNRTAAAREIRVVRPDGSLFYVDVAGSPITFEGNPATQIIAKDVTERKQAEDDLKRARADLEQRVRSRTSELAATVAALQSEIAERKRTAAERDKLVAAVESTAEAVVVTDKTGIIQYVNRAFEQITGYQRHEAIGSDIHIFDSGEHDQDFFRQMRETIAAQGVWKGRMVNKKKDGTLYHEDCTYSPVRDRSGNIVNYVSIKHDVTERLRLESIAETVDAMNNIGYVFSGIRHEIGNPVSSLLIIMNLLRKKYDSSPKEVIKEYINQATLQVERIEYLLTSLKNFNMYENLQIRITPVTSFMDKFVHLLSADLEKKGIQLRVEKVPGGCLVFIDSRALQQALLNIVVNASDALAGRPEPTISLSVLKAGGMVLVRVSDNGAGIDEEKKKDLFKPFYTTKANGTGLGLVITRKLISRMKGFIEIASRKDEGTVVDIYLPEGTIERTVSETENAPRH